MYPIMNVLRCARSSIIPQNKIRNQKSIVLKSYSAKIQEQIIELSEEDYKQFLKRHIGPDLQALVEHDVISIRQIIDWDDSIYQRMTSIYIQKLIRDRKITVDEIVGLNAHEYENLDCVSVLIINNVLTVKEAIGLNDVERKRISRGTNIHKLLFEKVIQFEDVMELEDYKCEYLNSNGIFLKCLLKLDHPENYLTRDIIRGIVRDEFVHELDLEEDSLVFPMSELEQFDLKFLDFCSRRIYFPLFILLIKKLVKLEDILLLEHREFDYESENKLELLLESKCIQDLMIKDKTLLKYLFRVYKFVPYETALYLNRNDFENITSERNVLLSQMDLKEIFTEFFEKFVEINSRQTDFQHVRCAESFFTLHSEKMCQLIKIMGRDGLKWLSSQLAGTVLTLERFLQSMPFLPGNTEIFLKKYFIKYQDKINKKDELNIWYNIIVCMDLLKNMNQRVDLDVRGELLLSMEPALFLSEISKKLLGSVLFDASDIPISNPFEKISPEMFIKLMSAKEHMVYDEYRQMFHEMLKRDLFGGSVKDFIHDESSLIGLHNKEIRRILMESGLDAERALNYTRTKEFIYQPQGSFYIQVERTAQVLKEHLWAVEEEINKLPHCNVKTQSKLEQIKRNIAELDKIPEEDFLKKILEQKCRIILEKICKILISLKGEQAELTETFFESATRFIAQYEGQYLLCLEQVGDTPQAKKVTLAKPAYFRIEQWDKNDPSTFFLGDSVGCCLATDGENFSAMVQRRMDDAMLFHVVVDTKTGKPAALVWLYFAQDLEKKMYLVGNFIEIAAKYGVVEDARQVIINALLCFTDQYCKDVNVEGGFIINQLRYGYNVGHVSKYPLSAITLSDKVGGAYIPHDHKDDSQEIRLATQQRYYLVSLDKTEFHRFSSDLIPEEQRQRFE